MRASRSRSQAAVPIKMNRPLRTGGVCVDGAGRAPYAHSPNTLSEIGYGRSAIPLVTYLHFNGNCREAFDFYRSVFGGEYLMVSTFADGPPDMGVPESDHDKIMHASLSIGDGELMGSDMPSNFGPSPVAGNNFSLSYSPRSREEADEMFAKISEGGTVTMPMEEMFWGAYFGSCRDKFGINWQLDYELSGE